MVGFFLSWVGWICLKGEIGESEVVNIGDFCWGVVRCFGDGNFVVLIWGFEERFEEWILIIVLYGFIWVFWLDDLILLFW